MGIHDIILHLGHSSKQMLQPCSEFVRIGVKRGRRHKPHIGGDARQDLSGALHTAGFPHPARRGDGAIEIRIIDSAGVALPLQRRRRMLRMLGVVQSHLQKRKQVFHSVIGGKRGVERRRRLQFALADRGQNLGLHRRYLGCIKVVWRV